MLLICIFSIIYLVQSKEDCDRSTREDRCGEIFRNLTDCNKDSYRTQLMDCLVTCGKCGAYSCNNPQPDTVLNCTSLASQCHSKIWGNFMKDKCPSTCGKCDLKNANLCKDASNSAICSTMVQFCNSVDYYDRMTEQCASTCNRCPATGDGGGPNITVTCVDYARDCATRTALCNNPQYEGLMHRACAKTCNKCGGCYDYSSKCPLWASRGFCSKSDQNVKRRYCAKTCMLC
ncbi:unnamed protein product [Cylicocyclus nassatus]|uniref:ShKT domain-containing protein n=1 Tax=Cylicocyclus nassatus TaxID=53992 RepID=A0AA36M439_CYLNA|nr:unnamed protein product [Cylicocyclus nassatus]